MDTLGVDVNDSGNSEAQIHVFFFNLRFYSHHQLLFQIFYITKELL
jgi:hypothetical protein